MPYRVYVDSFSGALGDLPVKQQQYADAVLDVLRRDGRFSVFDVTATLARTLDRLKNAGRIVYPEPQPGYPWCQATVVDPAPHSESTER